MNKPSVVAVVGSAAPGSSLCSSFSPFFSSTFSFLRKAKTEPRFLFFDAERLTSAVLSDGPASSSEVMAGAASTILTFSAPSSGLASPVSSFVSTGPSGALAVAMGVGFSIVWLVQDPKYTTLLILTQFLKSSLVALGADNLLLDSLGLSDLVPKGENPAVTLTRRLEVKIPTIRDLKNKFGSTNRGDLSNIGL